MGSIRRATVVSLRGERRAFGGLGEASMGLADGEGGMGEGGREGAMRGPGGGKTRREQVGRGKGRRREVQGGGGRRREEEGGGGRRREVQGGAGRREEGGIERRRGECLMEMRDGKWGRRMEVHAMGSEEGGSGKGAMESGLR